VKLSAGLMRPSALAQSKPDKTEMSAINYFPGTPFNFMDFS
jgi:hypothetical protein